MARASKTKEVKKPRGPIRWRMWAGVLLAGVVCVSTGMAALKVRQYALADPQFKLTRDKADALTITGLRYASRSKVQRVFAADFGHSVFSVPIEERRRRLLAIDWIEDASVLRIWPDRLSVHVRERTPVAFVFLRSGVLLIDGQGVLLEPPTQAQFTFPVLSGVREDETDEQRRERVRAKLRVQAELGYLAKDISEVNVGDTENIRIVAQVEHRAIELILGDTNYAPRFQNFINHYPEIRKRSPEVKTFDLRLDDRITAKE
jgi:cell division protein FtsQ